MFRDDLYDTPEGFTLPKPLLLPDVRTFAEVLTYVREWDSATMSSISGRVARPDLIPRVPRIHGNIIEPYCSIRVPECRFRGIAVTPTDLTLMTLTPRLFSDDRIAFRAIVHASNNRALIIATHSRIIANHWLAYVDPTTLPPAPAEEKD